MTFLEIYIKIHDSIIEFRKKNPLTKENCDYFETHHILPKSLGGNRNKENLVTLTAREHYVIHELLVRIYKLSNNIVAYKKMLLAWNRLAHDRRNGRFINSILYEKLKKENAIRAKSYKPTKETIEKCRSKLIGRKLSEEHKKKLTKFLKNRKKSKSERKKLSIASKGKIYVYNEQLNKIKRINKDELEKYLSEGWIHKSSPNSCKKRSKNESGEKNPSYGKKWLYNEFLDKQIYVKESEIEKYLNEGYIIGVDPKITEKIRQKRFGRKHSEETKKKMSDSGKGKVWMHIKNTEINTKVDRDKIDEYLLKGYILGQSKSIIEKRRQLLIGKKRKPYKKRKKQ